MRTSPREASKGRKNKQRSDESLRHKRNPCDAEASVLFLDRKHCSENRGRTRFRVQRHHRLKRPSDPDE